MIVEFEYNLIRMVKIMRMINDTMSLVDAKRACEVFREAHDITVIENTKQAYEFTRYCFAFKAERITICENLVVWSKPAPVPYEDIILFGRE